MRHFLTLLALLLVTQVFALPLAAPQEGTREFSSSSQVYKLMRNAQEIICYHLRNQAPEELKQPDANYNEALCQGLIKTQSLPAQSIANLVAQLATRVQGRSPEEINPFLSFLSVLYGQAPTEFPGKPMALLEIIDQMFVAMKEIGVGENVQNREDRKKPWEAGAGRIVVYTLSAAGGAVSYKVLRNAFAENVATPKTRLGWALYRWASWVRAKIRRERSLTRLEKVALNGSTSLQLVRVPVRQSGNFHLGWLMNSVARDYTTKGWHYALVAIGGAAYGTYSHFNWLGQDDKIHVTQPALTFLSDAQRNIVASQRGILKDRKEDMDLKEQLIKSAKFMDHLADLAIILRKEKTAKAAAELAAKTPLPAQSAAPPPPAANQPNLPDAPPAPATVQERQEAQNKVIEQLQKWMDNDQLQADVALLEYLASKDIGSNEGKSGVRTETPLLVEQYHELSKQADELMKKIAVIEIK